MVTLKFTDYPRQVKTIPIVRWWGIKIKPPSVLLFSEEKKILRRECVTQLFILFVKKCPEAGIPKWEEPHLIQRGAS